MSSLIPILSQSFGRQAGFEYDIFISYRHNDNRSGWVTDFVNALQEELAATIKEPISIYFDQNPHDGLLETHNVDKSLEGKLKCLIFIPIISQTYCDTKSFAWQHEFVAFNKLAGEDTFGRDIKLSNGNVASRILPIKIHDLDAEDIIVLQNELDFPLRCIEFIYKAPGVNRPLRTNEDHPTANINKTFYRDQINKVSHAIKEIVMVLKSDEKKAEGSTQRSFIENKIHPVTKRNVNRMAALILITLVALFLVIYFVIPKDKVLPAKMLDKSIAILPFENLSGDPSQEYFSDGIAEEILNALAQINDLKVPGRTSSFQFKGKAVDLREVGEKLKVSTVLEGSVRKQGNKVRITAQLVDVETGYHLWSQQFDRTLDDVFAIQEEIARTVTEKLKVTLLKNETIEIGEGLTKNKAAYDAYLKGRYFWNRRDLKESETFFHKAINLDSTFAAAYAGLAETYVLIPPYSLGYPHEYMKKSEQAAKKAIDINSSLAEPYACLGYKSFIYDWNPVEAKKYLEKSIQTNPKYAPAHYWTAQYLLSYTSDVTIPKKEIEKAIALDPLSPMPHYVRGQAFMIENKLEEAIASFKSAAEFQTANSYSLVNIGYCYIALGKKDEALKAMINAGSANDRARAALVYLYVNGGKRAEAERIYKSMLEESQKKYISKTCLANAASFLGKKDLAHEFMKQAIEEHDSQLGLYPIVNLPLPNDVLSDPRNVKLMEKNGLLNTQ